MIVWFIRTIFILLVYSLLLMGYRSGEPYSVNDLQVTLIACSVVVLLGLSVDLLVPRKRLSALAGIFFGLIVGLLIGTAINYVVEFIYQTYNITPTSDPFLYKAKNGIMWLVNVLCSYLAITLIMQTKDDFRFIIPYVEFSKQTKGNYPLLLDTSVIIDGRIADIAATKIISAPLIVPRFVLHELQLVADSADHSRRIRGRRGLDVLNKMQSNPDIDITIQDVELNSRERTEPVDLKLVAACQKLSAKIITNDYNLNKVAKLRGVDVININDLAKAMKPVVLPGEPMRIKIIKPGDQPGQGVGYLNDGTMVVVEQAREFLGQEINVLVTSSLQTSAGRMIFGRAEGKPDHNTHG